MKNLFTSLFLFVIYVSFSQTTLVSWNFSDSNATADGGTSPNLTKVISTNSTGAISYPTSTSGTCGGGYILNSGWDNGANSKYWTFGFVSTSYNTLSINHSHRSSGTGPRDFKVMYSVTSASSGFLDVAGASYSVVGTTCTDFSFSLPADCDDLSNVWIRIIMTSNTSQAGGTVASGGTNGLDNISITAAISLPINLTQFNAFFQNNAVQLNWSKSDAVNFDKFVVEHSTDGSNFVMLEEVAARTSTEYAVSHQNPTKGTNYYRLKLVDRDGSFAYSAVKTVSVKAENGWSIYPSKVNAQLTATLTENDDAVVCILNANGQILAKVEANGSTLVELPVGNLAAGLYLVQILDKGNLVYTQKFIKE